MRYSIDMAKCWASFRGGCNAISREHYISRAILGQDVLVTGPNWTHGTAKRVGPESLTCKCLCNNHNSELSELDSFIQTFTRYSESFIGAVEPRTARRFDARIFCGNTLLRWCCKSICGTLASQGQAAPEEIKRAAFEQSYCKALSLKFCAYENLQLKRIKSQISVHQYVETDAAADPVYLVMVGGLPFLLSKKTSIRPAGMFGGIPLSGKEQLLDRPARLDFCSGVPRRNSYRKHSIYLDWPEGDRS